MKSLIKKLRNNKTKKNKNKINKNKTKKFKILKYKNLSGGNNIEFKFINLNNYTEKEKTQQIKKIDTLLKNTNYNNGNSNFIKKNALRFFTNSIILYMIYNNQIIGIIIGNLDIDNYINIAEVEIRASYLTEEYKKIGISGRTLLTKYIEFINSKYPDVQGFKLFNAGGINSCFLYTKVFKELNYTIDKNINCNLSNENFTDMKFKKINTN